MRLLNPQGTPRPAVCLQYLERLKTDGHKKIKKITCDPVGLGLPASLTEDNCMPHQEAHTYHILLSYSPQLRRRWLLTLEMGTYSLTTLPTIHDRNRTWGGSRQNVVPT